MKKPTEHRLLRMSVLAQPLKKLHAVLAHLTTQDAHTDSELRTLLFKESELEHSFARLDLLRAHVGTQVVEANP